MSVYHVAGLPYSTELYHHGIKGQRWGHKNGPPYPLKANAHSKSEQKAGWRSSLDTEVERNNSGGLGLTGRSSPKQGTKMDPRLKRALVVGGLCVGVGLAAYGTYKSGALKNVTIGFDKSFADKFSDVSAKSVVNASHISSESESSVGKDLLSVTSSKISEEIKTISSLSDLKAVKERALSRQAIIDVVGDCEHAGFKLKDKLNEKKESWLEDAEICGKYYNPFGVDKSQANNCTRASIAFVMRRFGLSVEPAKVAGNNGALPPGASVSEVLKVFKGSIPEMVHLPSDSSAGARFSMIREIKSLYSDSNHAFGLMLAPGGNNLPGHAMAFEKIGNKVMLVDPQSGGGSKIPKIFDAVVDGRLSDKWILVRADDCGIDTDRLKGYVVNS